MDTPYKVYNVARLVGSNRTLSPEAEFSTQLYAEAYVAGAGSSGRKHGYLFAVHGEIVFCAGLRESAPVQP